MTIFSVRDVHVCATTLLFRPRNVALGLRKAVPADTLNKKIAAVVNFIVNERFFNAISLSKKLKSNDPNVYRILKRSGSKKLTGGCLMARSE